jgi:hypothetical protein
MTPQPCKLSDIMKEMAERLLRHPSKVPSSEAATVALLFANVAWNECVGLVHDREGFRKVWETIEADNPELWNELESNDINAMIDELVRYKQNRSPDDDRRNLTFGIPDGKILVKWLPPVAPGVDARWEMRQFGMVRTGDREQAIRFLKDTERISRNKAMKRVAEIAALLGIG